MALINLRNALMAGKRLPYDAEVEWLSGSGAYVDTGVNTADDVGFRVTVIRMVNTTTDVAAFGARQASGNTRYFVGAPSLGKWYFGWNTRIDYGSIDLNTPHTLGLNFFNNRKATFDNSEAGDLDSTITFSRRLFFPGYHKPTGEIDAASGVYYRFCGCQITKGSVLVRDFIPVRKGTVGYLYDRVTGKLFGNRGTGDFVLGPDVVPVEWLDGGQLNDGIAFIDTGYTPNSSTKIESTSAILSARGYSGRFGNQSRLAFGVGNGSLYLAQGNHYYLGGYTAGTFYSFVNDIPNRTVSVEGVGSTSTTAVSDWYPQLYPIYLFASNVDPTTGTVVNGKHLDTNSLGQIRMKSCGIWENDIPVHNYLPIRVGTDATSWEGAMMDVLTRRIYRNAGTGAFTYGNDLKYPIPAV